MVLFMDSIALFDIIHEFFFKKIYYTFNKFFSILAKKAVSKPNPIDNDIQGEEMKCNYRIPFNR